MKAIQSRLKNWLTPNPILVKELRARMRGPRAFITLTIALAIMSLLMIGLANLMTRSASSFGSGVLSPQIGQVLFEGLINFVLLLVCTVTPALTAGAISAEREKLTFEMLLATPLGPARILFGKLVSALSYVFLLIFAAIPLASLVFLFGGVAPMTMVKALFILVVVAISLGIYGLFLSALLGRTGRATVISFISVAVIMIGPLFLLLFLGLFYSNTRIDFPRYILAFSPISMLISAVETASSNSNNVGSLFGVIGGNWDPSMNPEALTRIPRPIYHYSLAICGGLSIILFTLSTGLLNPARRFYLSKRSLLGGGAALAGFAILIGSIFLYTAPHYEWAVAPAAANQPDNRAGAVAAPAPVENVVPARAYPVTMPTPLPSAVPAAYPAINIGPTPTVVTARSAAIPLEEQAAIFAAAARQVYIGESGRTGSSFPVIYLVIGTDDRVGSPGLAQASPQSFEPDLQGQVSAALQDLQVRIIWVGSLAEVPRQAGGGAILDGGLAITFGNIQYQYPGGSVLLAASATLSDAAASGQTFMLVRVNGAWKVNGVAAPGWSK